MRVPTISVYNQAIYQLNSIANELSEANEAVTTQNDINQASDDPIGMYQVLSINSSLETLDQTLTNVQQGQMLLSQAEASMNSVADQLSDIKLTCSQLASASTSPQDREDAAQNVDDFIDILLNLANTQINGVYVFAGTQNDVAPFAYDDPDNPTAVVYQGNDIPVSVSTSETTTMDIQCCGCNVFYENEIIVNSTNNQVVFNEDPGMGEEEVATLVAFIPDGTYTRDELALVVENQMTQTSMESGYGVGYVVEYDESSNQFSIGDDGKSAPPVEVELVVEPEEIILITSLESIGFDSSVSDIEIINPDALAHTTPTEGTLPLTLILNDEGNWTVENDPGYGLPSEIEAGGQFLDLDMDQDGVADIHIELGETPEPGNILSFDIVSGVENNNIGPDLGYDANITVISPAQSSWSVSGGVTVTPGANDIIDFVETLPGEEGQSSWLTATLAPGTYSDPDAYARAVENTMEAESAENGNGVNYEVAYNGENQTYSITESGDMDRQLESFDLLFGSGSNAQTSACTDLGFSSIDIHSGPVYGTSAEWGIFDTLFNLQEALATNDVDGIQQTMTWLDNHYNSIVTAMTEVGMQSLSLTATEAAISDEKFSLTEQLSQVEDVDSVESIIRLQAAENTYEAALSSTSTILGISLVDYLSI